MDRIFTAYDITGFLGESIGTYLYRIENFALDMAETDDHDERVRLADEIQSLIDQCNNVLR
jgi:hypothetical protein